jgi:membrane-associated protein
MENIFEYLGSFGQLSYFGMYLFIASSGHLIPLPEDIALMTSGYLTSLSHLSLLPMIAISIIGPMTGDFILFFLSKKGSRYAINLERHIKNEVFDYIKRRMSEHTFRTVFIMRFISGLRFASPLVAGYVDIPWKKYWLANTLSASIYGPFYLLIGYIFHSKILTLIGVAESLGHWIFLAIIVVIFGTFAFVAHRKIFETS